MHTKKRKPRWEVSPFMQDAAWRMTEDVREQILKFPERHFFLSETKTDRGTISLVAEKSYALHGEGISVVSCGFSTFENAVEPVSSTHFLVRDSWENVKAWLMEDHIGQIAEVLADLNEHTHSWD